MHPQVITTTTYTICFERAMTSAVDRDMSWKLASIIASLKYLSCPGWSKPSTHRSPCSHIVFLQEELHPEQRCQHCGMLIKVMSERGGGITRSQLGAGSLLVRQLQQRRKQGRGQPRSAYCSVDVVEDGGSSQRSD